MKKQNRIFAVLMTLAMLLGVFAFAIPFSVAADARPIELEKNADIVINGVTFRVDALTSNPGSAVLVNPDGTVTVRLKNGDMFWMPNVTIDEQSEATLKVSMSAGLNNAYSQQASGFTFNIKPTQTGVWGTDSTDECTTVAHRTARRLGVYGATLNSATSNGAFTKNYLHIQLSDTQYRDNNGFNIGDGCWGPGKTLITKTAIVDGEMNVTFINATDGTEKTIYTVVDSSTANGMAYTGPIGFFMDWASIEGYCDYKIEEFTVKNALVDGVRCDFDLSESLAYDQISAPNMTFAGEAKATFDESDVDLSFEFAVDASVSETAELVVKRGETEIARSALNTLQKATSGAYIWATALENVQKTEIMTFTLELNGETVERSKLTYGLGSAYQDYLNSLGEPVSQDKLNAVSYSENFEGLNMTLAPGENIVNGQRWYYVKNSVNGSARITNGKLYITGNSFDRILFLDQVYDHVNYRFSMSVNYDQVPEIAQVEGEGEDAEIIGATGYVGGIFNLQEADGSGNQNALISAVTPDCLYLKQIIIKADGTITYKDERGDCPIEQTAGERGLWSQYWNAVQPGAQFYLYAYSGISNVTSGNFGVIPRNADQSMKGWGNCWGASKSYRTGVMGIFLGEGQASAYIDDIKVEVAGTLIKVDGNDYPIWGEGEVKVSTLERNGEKFIYATVNGELKYAGDTIYANRKTQITTSQIAISTRKVVADGETGLKWKTEINKADYDRIAADENIKSIQLGTVVAPTSAISGGSIKNVAGVTDIAAGSEWSATSATTYTFEGVRTIAKAERDTSYSGVGYLKITMQDDTVVYVYSDYVTRNHAFALSDLVKTFHDDDDTSNQETDPANTQTNENNGTSSPDDTTETAKAKKKGCGSTVLGAGAVMMVAILGSACVFTRKKKED